jgi:hypothetical protein
MGLKQAASRVVSTSLVAALAVIIASLHGPVTHASDTADEVFVQSDEAVVRESPSAAARPLSPAVRGEALLSFGRRGDWVNVLIHQGGESKNGWIEADLVAETPPADRPTPAGLRGRGSRLGPP